MKTNPDIVDVPWTYTEGRTLIHIQSTIGPDLLPGAPIASVPRSMRMVAECIVSDHNASVVKAGRPEFVGFRVERWDGGGWNYLFRPSSVLVQPRFLKEMCEQAGVGKHDRIRIKPVYEGDAIEMFGHQLGRVPPVATLEGE